MTKISDETAIKEKVVKPIKTKKRIKMRRLAGRPTNAIKPKKTNSGCMKTVVLSIFICCVAFVLYMCGTVKMDSANYMVTEFMSNYRKQYNQIIHGDPDYCKYNFETEYMFSEIRKQDILNQHEAIDKLESELSNRTQLRQSIALVGPSGVGKSLLAMAFKRQFPWQENIQTYSWNIYVHNEEEKFRHLRMIISDLSDCGCNLLIIDSLTTANMNVVHAINNIIAEHNDAENKCFIIMYIFSLNSMEHITVYNKQLEVLQKLPNTETIYFKTFNQDNLMDCINREAKLEDVILSKDDTNEILATLDAQRSGCKKVHAKVLVYGKKMKTTD